MIENPLVCGRCGYNGPGEVTGDLVHCPVCHPGGVGLREFPTLTEFILARVAKDEAEVTPHTVIISGGTPAPEVPNCIGADGHGCPERWTLRRDDAPTRWWEAADVQEQIHTHEMTHLTRIQRHILTECEGKRRLVKLADDYSGDDPTPNHMLHALAKVYRDHPDFDPAWLL